MSAFDNYTPTYTCYYTWPPQAQPITQTQEEKKNLKLEVFTTPKPKEQEPLRLALKQSGTSIVLDAVDENGHTLSHLITIHPDGRIVRSAFVSGRLGLKLDLMGNNKVVVE